MCFWRGLGCEEADGRWQTNQLCDRVIYLVFGLIDFKGFTFAVSHLPSQIHSLTFAVLGFYYFIDF